MTRDGATPTRALRKWPLIAFGILLLVGGGINLPLAIHGTDLVPAWAHPPDLVTFGSEAQRKGWPIPPPTPWPAVTSWSQHVEGRALSQHAHSQNESRRTTHQMQVDFFGWPLPSLRHAMFWSSADRSPRFVYQLDGMDGQDGADGMSAGPGTGIEFHDAGLQLHWPGVLLNPILFAVAAWLVLVAPLVVFGAARRALRLRRGACPECGSPRRGVDRCPACGWSVRRSAPS